MSQRLVVFHNVGGHPFDFLLKEGFRHCFAAVQADGYWVTVDGRIGMPVVTVVAASDFDLKAFYVNEGYTVAEMHEEGEASWLPLTNTNCVGLVKTVLGIRSWCLSPYQLYKRIIR